MSSILRISRRGRRIRAALVAWVCWAGAASAAPAMKLAPELAGVTPDAVNGRRGELWSQQLGFGGWQASALAPFDIRTWTWEALLPESRSDEELRVDAVRTPFRFDVRAVGAPDATTVRCVARGRTAVHTEYRGRVTDETTVTLPGYPRLDCHLEGAVPGRLSLRPDPVTQRDAGLLRVDDAATGVRLWNIQSVNNLATQRTSFPLGRFGYEFRAGGDVVAAVETLGRGRIWWSPRLEAAEREALAPAMVALLHYALLLEQLED